MHFFWPTDSLFQMFWNKPRTLLWFSIHCLDGKLKGGHFSNYSHTKPLLCPIPNFLFTSDLIAYLSASASLNVTWIKIYFVKLISCTILILFYIVSAKSLCLSVCFFLLFSFLLRHTSEIILQFTDFIAFNCVNLHFSWTKLDQSNINCKLLVLQLVVFI